MVSPSASSRNVETHSVDAGPRSISASENERRLQVQVGRGVRLFFRPRAISALLKAAYLEWSKDKAPRMGAALAYYTIFSLAPLLIIAVAIAGLAFGMQAAQGEIAGQIQGLVGRDGAKAIQAMIQSAYKPAHGRDRKHDRCVRVVLRCFRGILRNPRCSEQHLARKSGHQVWNSVPRQGAFPEFWYGTRHRILAFGFAVA